MARARKEPRLYLDQKRKVWVVRYQTIFKRTKFKEHQREEAEAYLHKLLTGPSWVRIKNKVNPQGLRIGARNARDGVLYFVSKRGCNEYPIKIGFCASKLDRRVIDLQTGNPEPLEILVQCPATFGNEQVVHMRLADARIVGEWFRRDADVLAALEAARAGAIDGWLSQTSDALS